MFSLGQMEKCSDGRILVGMIGNKGSYFLANPEDVKENYLDVGLFKYEPQDQFCHWVDVKKIELKVE